MAYFGEGSGPIHVDNVKCSGEERSLADCVKRAPGTHNCRHSEDAGVICDYGQSQLSSKEVKGERITNQINLTGATFVTGVIHHHSVGIFTVFKIKKSKSALLSFHTNVQNK